MKLEFLGEAEAEFCKAAVYYEEKERGLGKLFRVEVEAVCFAILDHPLIWREREGGFRRVNCPVFPYYVAYFIRGAPRDEMKLVTRTLSPVTPRRSR